MVNVSLGIAKYCTAAAAVRVLTEYGITDLFGKNLKQRAKALINLAHPDHREELERAVYKRFYKGAGLPETKRSLASGM